MGKKKVTSYYITKPQRSGYGYSVKPSSWAGFQSYKSITFKRSGGREKFRCDKGGFIYVAYADHETPGVKSCPRKPANISIGIAQIVEIRSSPAPDYVRVVICWLYRPEDLPHDTVVVGSPQQVSGRQPYHGCNEMILSDHYDIVSVRAIHGRAVVEDVTCGNEVLRKRNVYHFRQFYRRFDRTLTNVGLIRSCEGLHGEDQRCLEPEKGDYWPKVHFNFK